MDLNIEFLGAPIIVLLFYIFIITCNVLNVKNHGKCPTAVADAAASAP